MTTFYMTPRFLAQYETLGVWVVLEVEVELVQKEICQSTKSRNIYLEISVISCSFLEFCTTCSQAANHAQRQA